ncbi:hypothetical protein ACLOJK_025476 [Asimina triloba]
MVGIADLLFIPNTMTASVHGDDDGATIQGFWPPDDGGAPSICCRPLLTGSEEEPARIGEENYCCYDQKMKSKSGLSTSSPSFCLGQIDRLELTGGGSSPILLGKMKHCMRCSGGAL